MSFAILFTFVIFVPVNNPQFMFLLGTGKKM